MTTIIDDIEDAMAAASLNCRVTYGLDVAVDDVTQMISDYGTCRILQATTADVTDSDIVVSSGGAIWDTAAFMICIDDTPKAAVNALHAWFTGLGFETENGVIGIPGKAPWTFQTLQIFKWQPAGGLPLRAEKLGEKWVALVAVQIQVRKP